MKAGYRDERVDTNIFLRLVRKVLPTVHVGHPPSCDVPFALDSKRVLADAAMEAETRDQLVDTAHIFLGLLHNEKSFAAELLREHGLSPSYVTDELEKSNLLPARNGQWQPLTFVLKAVSPKLTKGNVAHPDYYHDGSGDRRLPRRVRCENTTMAEFAENLPLIAPGYICGGTVVDATGLTGAWNFTLNFSPAMASSASGTPTLFEALETQLGLRLEKSA